MTPAQRDTAQIAATVERDLVKLAQMLAALGPQYIDVFEGHLLDRTIAIGEQIQRAAAAGMPPDSVAQADFLTYRLASMGVKQIMLVLAETRRLESEAN